MYLIMGSTSALWLALLLGLAQGMCLGVSYDQIVQYAKSPEHASAVSAVTSIVGVAIGSAGPLLYGYGLESTCAYVFHHVSYAFLFLIHRSARLSHTRKASQQSGNILCIHSLIS